MGKILEIVSKSLAKHSYKVESKATTTAQMCTYEWLSPQVSKIEKGGVIISGNGTASILDIDGKVVEVLERYIELKLDKDKCFKDPEEVVNVAISLRNKKTTCVTVLTKDGTCTTTHYI